MQSKKKLKERKYKMKLYLDNLDMLDFFLNHIELKHEADGTTTYRYNPDYLSPDRIEPIEVSFPDVKNSWEVLSAVSFGNFNECPDTDVIVEQSKIWYENYQAEIVEIHHDSIKYSLPDDSLNLEKIHNLKNEILFFAPDSICFYESEADMSDSILKDKCFYLWWD